MNIFKKKKQPQVDTFLGVRKARPPKVHRHQVLVPFLTFLMLGIISCGLFLLYGGTTVEGADVKRVQVYVDGHKRTIPTRAPTVGELLSRINIHLDSRDIVEPGINSPISEDDLHINVYRAKPVTVIDSNGDKVSAKIAATTPENSAEKAGFNLYPEDQANIADPDTASSGGVIGELITIDRAVPIKLNLYGKKVGIRTQADTVGGLLQEKGIVLGEKDKVIPRADTPIKKGMNVLVLRNGKQIINVEEDIAPPVDRQFDATMDAGTIKVIDAGKPGKRLVTYEVVFKHDKEVDRKVIQSVVVSQPKKRKVIEGTKNTGFGGGFDAALARLRSCEGSYSSRTGNGYYGAYQFNLGSWQAYAPSSYKNSWANGDIPPAYVQDQAAANYYRVSGWRPWPTCSVKMGLQDIYR